MLLRREITAQIKEVLEKHPEGLSITDLVKSVDINRNTAGRYLENLLLSGQVEMRRFGMSKMYTLAKRLPVSSVLSLSSEFVLQLDLSQRVIYANEPFLRFLGTQAKDLLGKNIEFTPFSTAFEEDFPYLLDRFRRGLKGVEWRGEILHPVNGRVLLCRVAPTVFNEGAKGVSILLEDITDQKRDAERIRESEARLRSIFKVSPIGIGVIVNRTFFEVNDRFCQITGYSAAEMIGKSVRMLYSSEEEFRKVGVLYMNQIRETGFGSVETRWVKKGGTLIDVLLNTTPLDPANISGGITFTALDITERKRAEQALRDSEERLHLALSASETGMWEMDFPSGKGSIDEGAAEILGYAKDEIGTLQVDWDALTHPDDVPLIAKRITDYLEGRTSMFESEHRMRHKSGEWIWVLGRGKVTHTASDGSGKRISGTLKDITARKMVVQALRESEEKYRYLVEQSLQGLIIVQDGRPVYTNPAIRKVTGYSPEEFQAFSPEEMMDTVHPDDRDRIRAVMRARTEGHDISNEDEFRIRGKDGTIRCVLARGIRITYNGRPAEQVTYFDITERKMAEQALRESEDRYRKLVEISPNAIILHQDGKIIYANQTLARFLGVEKPEDLHGREILDLIHPAFREVVRENIEKDLSGESSPFTELQLIREDGSVVFAEGQGVGTIIDGRPAVLVTIADISERYASMKALRDSEDQYRKLIEISPDAVLLLDDTGQITFANPEAARLFGARYEDLIGKNALDYVHPDYLDVVRENYRRNASRREAERVTVLAKRIDGTPVYVEGGGVELNLNGNPAVLVVLQDITERHRAEIARQESEYRYRTLAEASRDLIFVINRDDRVEYVNSFAATLVGLPADQVVGKPRSSLFSGELGERQYQSLRRVFETGKSGRSEGPMTIAGSLRWFDHFLMPIPGTDGTVSSVLGVSRDITNRREAEEILRANEERYRTLIEQTFDAVAVHKDGNIVFLNERAARILGAATTQELTGRPIMNMLHPDSRKYLDERLQAMAAEPWKPAPVLREKFFRVDGSVVTVDVMAVRFTENGRPAVKVWFREVTG